MISNTEFSTDRDWNNIIKKAKYQSKTLLASKILNLKERKWNKENMLLSDIIKDNRDNLDSYLLTKFLNFRLKLQEHFKWLIWAITYFYHTQLFQEQYSNTFFNQDEIGLPNADSVEWMKGFEWKGIFIRVQTNEQSKYLFQEIKALNYLFFEYIQIIDNTKIKSDEASLLSNELLFPLISYSSFSGIVLFGSVCVNKYSYDIQDNDNNKNVYGTFNPNEKLNESNLNNKTNPYVRYIPRPSQTNLNTPRANKETINFNRTSINNNNNNKSQINAQASHLIPSLNPHINLQYTSVQIPLRNNINRQNSKESANDKQISYNYTSEKLNKNNDYLFSPVHHDSNEPNEISHITNNNSFHSMNLSHNINKDVDIGSFSKDDMMESPMLSKIENKHLIKIIDDLNENNYNTEKNSNTQPKFKFMVIAANLLIPNLLDFSKQQNMILIDENENNVKYINNNFLHSMGIETHNKIEIIEKLIDKEYDNYETNFYNKMCKIFYSKSSLNSSKESNQRINENFVKNNTKHISEKLLSPNSNLTLVNNILKEIPNNSNQLNIKGKAIVIYTITTNVKIKYALMKSFKSLEYHDNYIYKNNFANLLEKFSKNLDNNFMIENVNALKNYFHRYGINSSMQIFILPKIKNQKIADIIKIDILCKLIKQFYNSHESVNFMTKMNLLHSHGLTDLTNEEILQNGFFDFIKEKSIFNIQKVKIFNIILSILHSAKVESQFYKFFNENLNFLFLLKFLKWRTIDGMLELKLFSDQNNSNYKYNHENILSDIIETARKRPFLFLNSLENHLKIIIDPMVKFKSSISKEHFIKDFCHPHIFESEQLVSSYINCNELGYYFFTKCIHATKTSARYEKLASSNKSLKPVQILSNNNTSQNIVKITNVNTNSKASKDTKPSTSFNNTKNLDRKMIPLPNNLKPSKINNVNQDKPFKIIDTSNMGALNIHNIHMALSTQQNFNTTEQNVDSSISKMKNNIKINSNNITKINNANNRYVESNYANSTNNLAQSNINDRFTHIPSSNNLYVQSEKSMSKERMPEVVQKEKKDIINEEDHISKSKIWDNLAREMDLNFPPILHKLLFRLEEKTTKNNKNKKYVNKFLKPNYFFNRIDTVKDWKSNVEMLLNDIVTHDSSENVLLQAYVLIFIQAFYIDNDYSVCKEILYKIKEHLKMYLFFKFENLSLVNLLEGLLTERKNYIECEEFFSKCLIFSLLVFGDPRGRGNSGNPFMLFPLWKIARQTCILENSLTNENFKEMFHSQDYITRNFAELNFPFTNSLYDPNVHYINKEGLGYNTNRNSHRRKKNEFTNRDDPKIDLSEINFDDDINENQSLDEDDFEKNFILSDNNFEIFNRLKYFPFPSISDVKTSYQTYFNSEIFISFLLKNIIPFNSSSSVLYDEETLTRIGLNCYSVSMSVELNSKAPIYTGGSFKSTISKKDKMNIFSPFMYDYLMEKMNYKKVYPDGIMLSWGNNCHNETTHNNYDFLSLPRMCYKLKDIKIVKVVSGWEHNVVISNDRKCYSWGNNESGQCGVGSSPIIFNPLKIELLEDVVQTSCGNDHTLCLNDKGELYTWGKSEGGVLGYNDKEFELYPKKMTNLKDITMITCGSLHNLALDFKGNLYSWGCAEGGQLGLPENFLINLVTPGALNIPTPIQKLKGIKISKISCGEAHSLALTKDGLVYGWGFTSNGQLGFGNIFILIVRVLCRFVRTWTRYDKIKSPRTKTSHF